MFKHKILPTLMLALTSLSAQNLPAGLKMAQPLPAPASLAEQSMVSQLATQAATLTIGGKNFPKLSATAGSVSGCSCQVYDTRQSGPVARITIYGPYNDTKGKPTPPAVQETDYSPPGSCWVITSYTRAVNSAAGSYNAKDDAQPPNFQYLTSTQYNSELDSIKSYVASLNIADKYKADLNAKLEDYVKSYNQYSNSISTSHGQVRQFAQTFGLGTFSFKGRSWYDGYISTTETCAPAEVKDAAALRKSLRTWVDSVAKSVGNVLNHSAVEITAAIQ